MWQILLNSQISVKTGHNCSQKRTFVCNVCLLRLNAADSVGRAQQNSTSERIVRNSCSLVQQQSSAFAHNPHLPPRDEHRTQANVDMVSARPRPPRPVRQSTCGQLMLARHGATPSRPGDEAGADGGLPTETAAAVKHPTRRASAPCNSQSPASVSIYELYQGPQLIQCFLSLHESQTQTGRRSVQLFWHSSPA